MFLPLWDKKLGMLFSMSLELGVFLLYPFETRLVANPLAWSLALKSVGGSPKVSEPLHLAALQDNGRYVTQLIHL